MNFFGFAALVLFGLVVVYFQSRIAYHMVRLGQLIEHVHSLMSSGDEQLDEIEKAIMARENAAYTQGFENGLRVARNEPEPPAEPAN